VCGITGILHFNKLPDAPQRVVRMTNAIAHRGPDAEGFYDDPCIALGHRRLSILDLSGAANQPFFDTSGNYVMVFNGEIYNYLDLRSEEHTSELQSHHDLVCRLLLEKKNTHTKNS